MKWIEVVLSSFGQSFKEHPGLTIFVLIACAGVLGYSFQAFAEKDDLQSHIAMANSKFEDFDTQIRELGFGITTRGLEAEIFALEMTVERGNAVPSEKLRLKKLGAQLKEVRRVNALANEKK